jgi:DNA polymerase
MLVALAPGAREDKEGRMFIGPSGRVLDELLRIGRIERESVYMTNLVKCRLPRNRRPKADEIEACAPYLAREIDLVNPRIVAPLGHYATRSVFAKYQVPVPTKPEFRKVYGTVVVRRGKRILPLQHPSSLLHAPGIKGVLETNYRRLGEIAANLRGA